MMTRERKRTEEDKRLEIEAMIENVVGMLAITERDRAKSVSRYDEMCRAITAAYEIDEVKDIRDKARAYEIYYRQAQNREAERQASDIRLRAERNFSSEWRRAASAMQAKAATENHGRRLKP
jgi:hypothetical protein